AIDPTTDEPGISYFDMDATSLKYTYYTGSAWSATTVENSADYGRFNSLIYDSVGNVHISHERNSADDLYYTSDKTGSWVSTAIDTANSVGTYTSIAVDSNDDLHIAYRHNTWTRTMHATVQGYKVSSAERANVSGATCSISPSLPFGLSLNQGTCTISGTPTSHGSNITYNVTATSSTGVSKSGEFNLWITQIAPSISYTGSPFTFTVGTAISSITPTNTGDSAFWSVSPSLPSGLSLGAGGVISGTPSLEASTDSYTITASNPGGESSATISITVNAQPPSGLSYATENMTLEKGTAMTANTASVGGGTVSSWEVFPSLPNGLALDSTTGSISGTPTVLQTTAVTYTVWANNSGGSSSVSVNITINDVAPSSLSYATENMTLTKGVSMSSNNASVSGGTVTSWEIYPTLPSGLSFGNTDGEIVGTPTVLQTTAVTYTVWANNSGGSTSTTLNITINDAPPNTIVYGAHDLTLEKGTAMTTTTPAISGGATTSWEISPSIPNGLSFSSTTGAISGTPTVLQTSAVTYTIWANNSGGSASTQMNITINDQIASVSYPSTIEVSNDRAMTTVTPTNTGGAVTSWVIVPSLPSGLNFGSSNGSIWGTPSGLLANATYTVYANNSGGSTSNSFTLGLNWTLTPSVDGAYITRNTTMGTGITWQWDYDPLEGDSLSLVTGEYNTCAIKDNGDVYCWGRNGNGQIGNGQISNANTACGQTGHKCKDVPTLTNVKGSNGYDAVSLAFGDRHACALLDDGDVVCWGRNNAGQLGTTGGDKDTPQAINLGTGRTATSIYAGGNYNCAILDDASVKCWGQNDQGQLGIGTSSNTNTPTTVASFGTGRTAVALATAFKTVCALLDDGSVKCWGDRADGLLGNGGSTTDLDSPPASPINLGTGRTAKAITGGEQHFCAILDDDSVKCWGNGANGKLGTGSTSGQNTPTSTSGSFGSGRYAVAIDAGYQHTCVILDNGALTCWGDDSNGQLGNGATTGTKSSLQSATVNLGAGRTAISLSAGGKHTCAQLDNDELMCWGHRGSGQVGDNGGFNNPSDRTSPVSPNGGHTYLDTGVFPSSLVADATCSISPALPAGMSLTQGTCAIAGTPTATATNATYTVWANISGQSFSGQVWIEVGLNAPLVTYPSASYTFTKDSPVSVIVPSNTGGEVSTWAFNGTLPSGLSFGTSNGSIWGTPDTITPPTTYTVWANNSAGSQSVNLTLRVNDVAPSITFAPSSLELVNGTAMTAVSVSNSGGSIVSCSVSPSLPSGLSLSNTCVLSGTPTNGSTNTTYTLTATNSGGSDTTTFSLMVQAAGGSLTITPSHRVGSANSALANITMSYTHTASNYGWTSGVSNTTTNLATNFDLGAGIHWLGVDSGEQGEMVVVYARKDSTTTTHSLALLYQWNGSWTETILDNGTNTGLHPSVAIDRQGAIHIAYIDDDNDKLRYATNASGSWVLTTLGNSSFFGGGGRGTALVVHPITDAVHIVTTIYENSVRGLQYHTNEGGSWVNETITDTTKAEGYDPAMAMDGDGNLYVAHYCSSGCNDLRLSSRMNGVWQNETVSSTNDIGQDPDIAIDSQGTIHIVSRYASLSSGRIYLHSGTPGSWTVNTGLGGGNAYWPVVGVDSNDAVHISYHRSWTYKNVMYMTNASGSWSTASVIENRGGWGSEMVIDANDDVFVPNFDSYGTSFGDELQLTTVQGSGQGLTAHPIYDVSPMLPDGLKMNWRNGTISGTPTQSLDNTTFTVTVTALGVTTTGTFSLFITGEPGIIAYSDIMASNRTAITLATASLTNNNTSGIATSWAISPTLPSGLSFGTTNGSIWGTPAVEQVTTTYTVWANNTAGSSSTTVNITVGPATPGPFKYVPENTVRTNNTEVYLAPQFFDQITGNGSTWQAADIRSGPGTSDPGKRMSILVGDTMYFDAYESATGIELYAYDTSNHSFWRVTDIHAGSGSSYPGDYSSILLGDTLYFSAVDGSTGHELWAHNTSNGTTWQVANIRSGSSNSNPGSNMMHVVDGVLYFNAHDGNKGMELWKHDPSTGTTSRIYDINAGSTGSSTGKYLNMVVGDVLYFSANDGSTGSELWAYNTSNSSNPWRVADIHSGTSGSEPGMHMSVLVGDTIYFDAAALGGTELWAHNISNHSTWRVVDIYTGS
ncbi:MAG: putative Ig domain-containing protein, partial [Candidatus Thermoplasmatota archaeon]|nr:putative Ig domain-containing protein [Candidatus Thermoplasmatota archaeon]